MFFSNGAEGNKFANASVGENNIESSLYLRDNLVETIKVIQFGNISLNSKNVAADCLYGLVEFRLATARDEDIRTVFGEQLCRSKSNSFGTAGDDCTLPCSFLSSAIDLSLSFNVCVRLYPRPWCQPRFPQKRGSRLRRASLRSSLRRLPRMLR